MYYSLAAANLISDAEFKPLRRSRRLEGQPRKDLDEIKMTKGDESLEGRSEGSFSSEHQTNYDLRYGDGRNSIVDAEEGYGEILSEGLSENGKQEKLR
jgi:hypothetical protein